MNNNGNPFMQLIWMLVGVGATIWVIAILAGEVGRAVKANALWIAGFLAVGFVLWFVWRRFVSNRYW